ncbi:Alkane hydroxylase MAH1 [Linum perenne]
MIMMSPELAIVLLVLPVFMAYVVRKRNSSIMPNWPLIGMAPSLHWHVSRDLLHHLFTQFLKQNGGSFMFIGPIFTNQHFFFTSDPMNVQHIFSRNFLNYPKGKALKEILEPLGDGITAVDGDFWKAQREMVHTIINNSKFEQLVLRTLHRKLDTGLFPILDKNNASNQQLDLQDLMKRLSFDTISSIVLGFDPKSLSLELPHLDYAEAFDAMEEAILYRHCVPRSVWKFQKWLGIGEEAKMAKAYECFMGFLEERIKEKINDGEEKIKEKINDDDDGDDNVLTQFRLECERIGRSDFDFLRDVTFNFLVAGRDTIASAMTWFFWLVAINLAVEKNILEEMDRVLHPAETTEMSSIPSMEELMRLVYLEGAILETLRLYPSIPFEIKQALDADVLPSGHVISSGTKFFVSIYSMGRMEKIWGHDCMEFKPERWLGGVSQHNIVHVPSYKFAAFNAGPRSCLGRKIAITQLKVAASCVLRKYKIDVVEGQHVVPGLGIVLFMRYGLKITVSQRT